MKKSILIFIVISFLFAGCSDRVIEANADSNVVVENKANVTISPKALRTKSYLGCWIGTEGGAVIIDNNKLRHLTANKEKTYSYKVAQSKGDGVLLEVKDVPNMEFIRPFNYLQFEGKDEILGVDKIIFRGFESIQGFKENKFVTSEYFYKDDCKKLK